MGKIMTNEVYVQKLRNLMARPNAYNNKFPYNLGYFDGKKITGDCWNIAVKALIWNPDIDKNYSVGKYALFNEATGMGDWDGVTIMKNCTEVTSDFKHALPGMPVLYEDGSHMGVISGDMKVIEMTMGWGVNKMIETTIGPNGERIYNGKQLGRWKCCGKLPQIDYIQPKPEPVPEPTPAPIAKFKKGDRVRLTKLVDYNGNQLSAKCLGVVFTIAEEPSDNGNYIVLFGSVNGWLGVQAAVRPDAIEIFDDLFHKGDRVKLIERKDYYGTWLTPEAMQVEFVIGQEPSGPNKDYVPIIGTLNGWTGVQAGVNINNLKRV